MKRKRLGWKKDRFDPIALEMPRRVTRLPQEVDLSKWRPAIKDQGNCGSCVGMAISSILTAEANKLGVVIADYQRFSETDLYNGGRFCDGTLPYDEGTYASSVLKWASKKGCLPYKYWQYIGFEKKSRPSSLDQYAADYPLPNSRPVAIVKGIGYFRITGGIEGILSALADGYMVATGLPWPNKYMSSKDGILPTLKASDSLAGGHEVYLWGDLLAEEIVRGGNSWGETIWSYTGKGIDKGGKPIPKGCFTMPFSTFDWAKKYQYGYDAHIVIVDWATPEPPIPPTPITEVQVKVSVDKGQNWTDYIPK